MLRNLLAGVLALGVATSPVMAKPPGLSGTPEDRVTPAIAPWQAWNDQLLPLLTALPSEPVKAPASVVPTGMKPTAMPLPPALGRMPVGVRKQVVNCVLIGIHPLMMMAPIDALLDQPCDHPETSPMEPIGIHFTTEGILQVARPIFLTASEPAIRIELPAVDITRGVLDNLNKLLEADELYQQGEKCLAAGRLGEALDCFNRAAECCPGSQTSLMAQAAVHRVFARVYRPVVGAEESEVRTANEPAKQRKLTKEQRKANRAKKKAAKKGDKKAQAQPVVVNGMANHLRVPAGDPVPGVNPLALPPDNAGSAEEAEEPWWYLPWIEEWTVPGRTA